MSWTRPRALRKGDLLGVCAPSGPVDPERLEKGVAELKSLGFEVRVPEGVLERTHFTAGSAERRLKELHALLADGDVAGIVCARGGAGMSGVLGRLDAALLRARFKAVVGYSDITALHLFINGQGLTSFHGPMVARELAEGSYDRASFMTALTGEGAPYASESEDLLALRPGQAEGRLRGGCLTILAAAAGTPWALRTGDEPTILFLEDVDEPPYKIDRMLQQLRDSGALRGVRGIVFGDMPGCSPVATADYAFEDVVLDALQDLDVPIALGLSSGHTASKHVTLPLGARARLACREDEARFEVLEVAVA